MDKLNPLQLAQLHELNAKAITDIMRFEGIISIVAGKTKLLLIPGSSHYEQLKHKLSDFGCDHVARKLQAGEHNCTTDQQPASQVSL